MDNKELLEKTLFIINYKYGGYLFHSGWSKWKDTLNLDSINTYYNDILDYEEKVKRTVQYYYNRCINKEFDKDNSIYLKHASDKKIFMNIYDDEKDNELSITIYGRYEDDYWTIHKIKEKNKNQLLHKLEYMVRDYRLTLMEK